MKVVGICGEPGTGKTTIVREIIRDEDCWLPSKFNTLEYTEHRDAAVFVLGKYDGNYFDGTDHLSMAVIDDAESFLIARNKPTTQIIFEGDRLWCPRFIKTLITLGAELKMIRLTCDTPSFIQRHKARRDDGIYQDTKFISSRKTKYDNLMRQFPGLFEKRVNSNHADLIKNVDEIISFLEG